VKDKKPVSGAIPNISTNQPVINAPPPPDRGGAQPIGK